MFFKTKRNFEEAVDRKVREEMNRYDHDHYVDERINGLAKELSELQTKVYILERKTEHPEKKAEIG